MGTRAKIIILGLAVLLMACPSGLSLAQESGTSTSLSTSPVPAVTLPEAVYHVKPMLQIVPTLKGMLLRIQVALLQDQFTDTSKPSELPIPEPLLFGSYKFILYNEQGMEIPMMQVSAGWQDVQGKPGTYAVAHGTFPDVAPLGKFFTVKAFRVYAMQPMAPCYQDMETGQSWCPPEARQLIASAVVWVPAYLVKPLPSAPILETIDPDQGVRDTVVTLTGSGFTQTNFVYLGNYLVGRVPSLDGTTLKFKPYYNRGGGEYAVTVESEYGKSQNSLKFILRQRAEPPLNPEPLPVPEVQDIR